MSTRKRPLVILGILMAVLVLVTALPQVAGAAITGTRWSETAYSGYDGFYSATVVAYETGSEAELVVSVQNTYGVQMTVREAKVSFDWGSEYVSTSPAVPFGVKPGETKLVNFIFTVPGLDTATNQALHRYDVSIGYQLEGSNYVRNTRRWMGPLAGGPVDYWLPDSHVLGSSIVVYAVDWGTNTIATTTPSGIDERTGKVSFAGGVAPGIQLYADYEYLETASGGGWGDSSKTVFYAQNSPLIAGSVAVYIEDTVVQTFGAATEGTDYTIDLESGRVVFVTPPTSWERVWFTYEYYSRWTTSGTNFAVYSADQADARELKSQLNVLPTFGSSPEGYELMQEAALEENLGDTAYNSGNFADAKTRYDNALTKTQEALAADTANSAGYNDAMLGLASGGASILDAIGAKFDAEAQKTTALVDAEKAKLEAEADRSSTYGIFLLLVGIGGIIAAIGGVAWAASRIVAARRM